MKTGTPILNRVQKTRAEVNADTFQWVAGSADGPQEKLFLGDTEWDALWWLWQRKGLPEPMMIGKAKVMRTCKLNYRGWVGPERRLKGNRKP